MANCREECHKAFPRSRQKEQREKCRDDCKINNRLATRSSKRAKKGKSSKHKLLCDILFGEMNSAYLHSEDSLEQNSIDPRRSNALLQQGRVVSDHYSPNLSKSVVTPTERLCMVLRAQGNSHPWVENKVESLPQTFRHQQQAGKKLYYKYKVWPVEYLAALECPGTVSKKPGPHHPRIDMAVDAFPLPGSWGDTTEIPLGSLVHYTGDPSVGPIVLTTVTREQVRLPGVVIDKQAYATMASSFALGAPAVSERWRGSIAAFALELKKSDYFDGFSNEILCGMASNAEYESRLDAGAMREHNTDRDLPLNSKKKKMMAMNVENNWVCAFGYWQFDACHSGAGLEFMDWAVAGNNDHGPALTASDLSDTLGANRWAVASNKDNQMKFMARAMRKQFGTVSQGAGAGMNDTAAIEERGHSRPSTDYSAYYWAYMISTKFERCGHCIIRGTPPTFSKKKETLRRGVTAAKCFDELADLEALETA